MLTDPQPASRVQLPGPKSPLKNPILYSSLALLAVLLYVLWIFFSRWQENRELQRRASEERQLDKAAKILKMHKDQNLPYEPAEDGFVFSNNQIETFLRRQDRSDQANNHAFYADASGAGL